MEFITESGVVSVVMTRRRVVGPHGVCYREWSGVRYQDLSESGGATWSLLQRVEWCPSSQLTGEFGPDG